MAKKYGGLEFPFKENPQEQSLKRTESINKTIAAAIKCFLVTTPGQRRGNAIGSMVPTLKQKLIPSNSLEGMADEVKQELIDQFPGVLFENVALIQKKNNETNTVDLIIKITFSTAASDLEHLELFF